MTCHEESHFLTRADAWLEYMAPYVLPYIAVAGLGFSVLCFTIMFATTLAYCFNQIRRFVTMVSAPVRGTKVAKEKRSITAIHASDAGEIRAEVKQMLGSLEALVARVKTLEERLGALEKSTLVSFASW